MKSLIYFNGFKLIKCCMFLNVNGLIHFSGESAKIR